MTLADLRDALDILIKDGSGDEHIYVDINGACYALKTISVVVTSDIWVPDTIVATVDCLPEDEEGS